ncbi:UNVERIFIED_CONTAM: hypothetical protein Cloal_4124 [Acetivibrio alkalicellulosi]
MKEWKKLVLIILVFLGAFYIPFSNPRVSSAILESFNMLQEYAREHVLFCLIPAFFIAGAIANFISQGAVIKYFGSGAKKWVSYAVASVSGTILAVCSCTVLPLFAGIYKKGAGIGPAVAFLYAGPAVNVLAIILTARVLGWQLGVARAVGAILFAIVIGITMAIIYRKEDEKRTKDSMAQFGGEEEGRSPIQNIIYFASLLFILIFATWGRPAQDVGFFMAVFNIKWYVTGFFLLILAFVLVKWFNREERIAWVESSWDFAKQIFPLLFAGVMVAGFLMGRPGYDSGIIPSEYVSSVVGGNSLGANLIASVIGAFMYFATLTEIPIIQGLVGAGMGEGPALALLLAGPALSLPNMLVIRSVMGTKKTLVFVSLVVIFATISGMIFGLIV